MIYCYIFELNIKNVNNEIFFVLNRDDVAVELKKSEEDDSQHMESNPIGTKSNKTINQALINAISLLPSKRRKLGHNLTRPEEWHDFVYDALTGCPGTTIEFIGFGGFGQVIGHKI